MIDYFSKGFSFLGLIILIGITVLLLNVENLDIVYAQSFASFLWDSETTCQKSDKILSAHDKSTGQLNWLSKDKKERENFISNLTTNEINIILECAKTNLPQLKSDIIIEKIGFLEGENNYQSKGKVMIITIEHNNYLRIENFEIGLVLDENQKSKNPNLHVYLTKQGDFSDSVYLETLKTKVGSKNYPLRGIDFHNYDTVVVYDQISKEIFASAKISDPSFFNDFISDFYNKIKDVDNPKIDSKIIDEKTGTLQGLNGYQALGRVETPYEEDEAEIKLEKFQISNGYDFYLYATKDSNIKKSGDWTIGLDGYVYTSNTNTNEILRYNSTNGVFKDIFVVADNNGGIQGPKDLIFSPDGKYLYVSSFITNEIFRYDGKTGEFLEKFVTDVNSHGILKRPMKMILTPDGTSLYVSSQDNGIVLKFDTKNGKLEYKIDEYNFNGRYFELENPNGITLDNNEHIYIINTNTNEILRYNSTNGVFKDIFVVADNNGGIQGPKDLIFSPDGKYLYVSSFITNEIFRYDGKTGKFLEKFVSRYDGEISNPRDMVYGQDNNLYVTSTDTDQIFRFDGTSGKLLDIFADRDYEGMRSPKGLTFGPNGDLFVSTDEGNVLRYFDNGTFRGIFVEKSEILQQANGIAFTPNCYENHNSSSSDNECNFLVSSKNNLIFRYIYDENMNISVFKDAFIGDEEIKNPQNMVYGIDNNIYVSSFDTDEVLRFDGKTGKFMDVFASSGGLDGPTGMVFDKESSSFYVSSSNNNRVLKYNATTGEFLSILINDNGIIKKPQSIIKSLDGNLYVISSGTNEILQYDIDKDVLTKIVTDKSGGLYKPKDMEFNNNGDLCVNSLISNNIYCYNSENGKISNRIDISFNKGLPTKPHSEFSPDGEIFASNTLSNKISVYDRNTGFFSKIIINGEDALLQNPRNLVHGPDGNLYVSSNNNNQIVRIDGKSGKFMDVFVEPTNSGLSAPQGLAFHDGSLYVSSNENHRILRYDQITGKFIDEFIKSRSGGLITPRGLIFDEMNHLYVSSNENNKILRYDSVTGEFEKEIASGGILSRPVGLAFDNNGNLLVSSSGNNQILSYDVKSSSPKPTIIIADKSIEPQELVFDNSTNSLYISSDDNNRILKYDFDSKMINEVNEITKAGLLEKPYGLTVKDNELFISNGLADEILKYDIVKNDLQSFNLGSIGVLGPSGLTFGPDKNIYVISSKTHEIFRYNADSGGVVGIFATFPYLDNTNSTRLPDGQLQDLVFSPDGKYMYVSSIFTNEILRFDGQTGKFIDVFIDKNESEIHHPQNLVFSPDGKSLYVNSYETGSIFVYNATTGNLINMIPSKNQDLASNVKNIKFGKNGDLYITANDYNQILRFNPDTGNFIDEFELGGIELGKLEQNVLKKKYLLNNINTTRYDTIVIYDQFLEKPFATISLEDNLLGNLPIPVVRDMLIGNIGIVEEPVFESKPTEKWSGYFRGLNEIPTIGQVKVEQSEDIAIITLEVFEMKYKQDKYVSFNSDTGITKGPKIAVCLTDGKANTCNDRQNSVIQLGTLTANVGDQVYVVRNVNLEKFNTVLLFDNVLDEKFSETQLRHASILRLSPQLFIDWTLYQFPSFPLLLLTFIAFPLTFDYVRTVFKIIFLSIYLTKKGKRQKIPKMSTKKKITIMIPAHNEEAGIKASIEAALKTKYKNKEIIVIDDGSTDNTYHIARGFSEKGLIKLLHRKQASGSKAAALNYGFMYATGDLILCMDGDTLLVEDSLQNAVGYFDDEDVKAVSGNVKILSGDEDVTNTLTNAQKYEYLIAIELGRSFTSALNILLVISGAFGIFRRDIFSNTGKFDKDTITEDFDLTLKIRKTKGKIPFIRDSIARTYCPNNWKAWIKQRRRWAHGQMQTLKKHKDLMLSSKFTRRDRIAMFDMWALDIIMNFLFVIYLIILIPVSIIMIVYGNIHILVNLICLILITYLISETIIFLSATIISHKREYFKLLYLVPFMALFYRPFLKIMIFKSYINALRNKDMSW